MTTSTNNLLARKGAVAIHGFGNHPGGRPAGYSDGLRGNVAARIGGVDWQEAFWDRIPVPNGDGSAAMARYMRHGLLGLAGFALPLASQVFSGDVLHSIAHYAGNTDGYGEKVRAALEREILDSAAKHPDGVVVVAHSMGAVIAYDLLLRKPHLPVKGLVTLGSPLSLVTLATTYFRGRRLSGAFPAWDFYSEGDRFCAFHKGRPDIDSRSLVPPPGTTGLESHKFYWRHPAVAECVAGLVR